MYTAVILKSTPEQTTAEVSRNGLKLFTVTFKPDPADGGEPGPWGSWANWCDDPSRIDDKDIPAIVAAVREAAG